MGVKKKQGVKKKNNTKLNAGGCGADGAINSQIIRPSNIFLLRFILKKKNNDSNPAGTGKAALFLTELHFYRLGGQLCPKASRCNLVLLPPEKAFCDLVIGANYFP